MPIKRGIDEECDKVYRGILLSPLKNEHGLQGGGRNWKIKLNTPHKKLNPSCSQSYGDT